MRNAIRFAQIKPILTILLCSFFFQATAQSDTWLSYTLATQRVDSVTFNYIEDSTVTQYSTPFHYGSSLGVASLKQDTPTQNTLPNGTFTLRRGAALDLDLLEYPIRTNAKIVLNSIDTPITNCSGTMISQRHVLTAAHIFSDYNKTDSFYNYISIDVCPSFDQGSPNRVFGCAKVSKVYVLKNWNKTGMDVAILELNKDLGDKTGWVGVTYDNDFLSVSSSIFYRFSYPYMGLLPRDRNLFNGDTMYYNYGTTWYITDFSIGVPSFTGTHGEGGSTLIKVANNQHYSVYGTLNWAGGLKHLRFSHELVQGIEHLIKDHLSVDSLPTLNELAIYPNPTTHSVQLKGFSELQISQIQVTDLSGKEVFFLKNPSGIKEIDLERLPNGVYHLRISTNQGLFSEKIIKSNK